jgi:hypothetical protein
LKAQAWLLPKNEGLVSLSYQNTSVRDHAFSTGIPADVGHIFSDAIRLDLDYSITNRLAISVGLPYIFAKYTGLKPHPTWVDTSQTYHSTFQDFSVDIRYNVTQRPVFFTPFFNAVIPSHSYEYFAHSAVGADMRQLKVGANIGRRLNPILPRAYIQVRYAYTFAEQIDGVTPNSSTVDAQLGYFLSRHFSVLGLAQWIHTYDGVSQRFGLPEIGLSDEEFRRHDQISRVGLLDAGAGFARSIGDSWQIYASLAHSVEGRNAHLHSSVVTVSLSRSFTGRRVGRAAYGGPPSP